MKYILVLMALICHCNQKVNASMACEHAMDNHDSPRVFAMHPQAFYTMSMQASVFDKQPKPSKALLSARAAYQSSLANLSDLQKAWTSFQGEFCERYKVFLDTACGSHPPLSHRDAFFFHYPENFLQAFTTRLYFPNKENIAAYHRLEDDYVEACVKIQATQHFQKSIMAFSQEYSKKYYSVFSPFLKAFKDYQQAFFKSQPSYLEAALSFVCCFPLARL